jgi:hypothetical protein
MIDDRPDPIVMLRDNLTAYATILKNSGVPAEEALSMVKALAMQRLPQPWVATALGTRSVLDVYYPA